jgi:hypothetical protein
MATFSLARYKEGAVAIDSLRDLLLKTQLVTSGMRCGANSGRLDHNSERRHWSSTVFNRAGRFSPFQ